MSDKIRIYQLAKEIGVENKDLLSKLDEMGVEYKSHSSTLDHETAEIIKSLLGNAAKTNVVSSEVEAPKVVENNARATVPPVARAPEPVIQPKANSAPVETEVQAKPEPVATEQITIKEQPAIKEQAQAGSLSKDERKQRIPADAPRRAPVVTVMGHVDHGKTSLLDYIRSTKVAEKEAGGITQHIGAYQVQTSHGPITFFDTPGHEAFTTIRQRGASATDIAVIVVAADDSIMPQSREAIAHAKAARVPIIIAVNKIDLPQANVDKVKQDLMQLELIAEEFGGDTIVVPLSARTGKGVDQLLEMISLVAELENYRALTDIPAHGVIIEAVLDKRAGVLATVIVQEGTLKVTDYIVAGEAWAKVRAMTDFAGQRVTQAGPSVPVQILGFSDQPVAGETIDVVPNEVAAKAMVAERIGLRKDLEQEDLTQRKFSLTDLFAKKSNSLNLILRADTQGSLEAIKGVIQKEAAQSDEVELNIMLAEVGAPTETDLLLASTSDATVLTFGVTAPASVEKMAERQGTKIKSYKIIYQMIEDVQRMIRGQLEPVYEEKVLGHAEVRQIITIPKIGSIAGSYVTDGLVRRGAKARLFRSGKEIYKGNVAQLKRFKDDVREVGTGFECGINLQNYDTMQQGDVIEIYDMVEVTV
jgi:translation initiation factor IF-2